MENVGSESICISPDGIHRVAWNAFGSELKVEVNVAQILKDAQERGEQSPPSLEITIQGSISGKNWVDLTDATGRSGWIVDMSAASFLGVLYVRDLYIKYSRVIFAYSNGWRFSSPTYDHSRPGPVLRCEP